MSTYIKANNLIYHTEYPKKNRGNVLYVLNIVKIRFYDMVLFGPKLNDEIVLLRLLKKGTNSYLFRNIHG